MRDRSGQWNTLVPLVYTAMACPVCGAAEIAADDHVLACSVCGARAPGMSAVLDVDPGVEHVSAPLRSLAGMPRWARWWEGTLRPRIYRAVAGSDQGDIEARWLQAWFRPQRGPVVDLQCGTGHALRMLGRWVGAARLVGMDEDLAVLAQTQADTRDPGMAYVRTGPRWPFRDEAVGAVHCSGGLHSLADPEASVREVGRVLVPRGTFTGVVWTGGAVAGALGRWVEGPPISVPDLLDWMGAAGLEPRAVQPYGGLAWFAAQAG